MKNFGVCFEVNGDECSYSCTGVGRELRGNYTAVSLDIGSCSFPELRINKKSAGLYLAGDSLDRDGFVERFSRCLFEDMFGFLLCGLFYYDSLILERYRTDEVFVSVLKMGKDIIPINDETFPVLKKMFFNGYKAVRR